MDTEIIAALIGAAAAVVVGVMGLVVASKGNARKGQIVADEEYTARFEEAQVSQADIVPRGDILADSEQRFRARVVVLNRSIVLSTAAVLVSSDDNHFQARGGVARILLDQAGPAVERQLSWYRQRGWEFRQGDLVVTSGKDPPRWILHPVVIDLDEKRWPTPEVIGQLTRRLLVCAESLGARSISFPVLGGGTGSSDAFEPWESIVAILGSIRAHLEMTEDWLNQRLTYIELYVFDRNDIKGDLDALLGA